MIVDSNVSTSYTSSFLLRLSPFQIRLYIITVSIIFVSAKNRIFTESQENIYSDLFSPLRESNHFAKVVANNLWVSVTPFVAL